MTTAARRQPECLADAPGIVASAPELARRVALGDFSPVVRAWLQAGFARHASGDQPLETALRLDRASRLRVRDDALRAAAALLALHDEGWWPVAGRLAAAVVRFERKRSAPVTPLDLALAAAFAAGVRVPTTARQLYTVILD